jgi:two-component system sensor histidine kinase PilS (NtrC family)
MTHEGAPAPRGAQARGPGSTRTTDESWFGALGVEGDTGFRDDLDGAAPRRGARHAAPDAQDSRLLSREAIRVAKGRDETALPRIVRTYVAARAALAAAMLLIPWSTLFIGVRPAWTTALVCLAYLVETLLVWLWPRLGGAKPDAQATMTRLGGAQWLVTIGADLLAFSALHLLEPSSHLNYAALLVLPVLMAGIATPRVPALATTSAVTLLLLGAGLWRAVMLGADMPTMLMQAGLAGMGLFFIVLLAGEVASWLAREELAARGSLEIARQQAQLNRLVIEEMVEGVLVVDRRDRVRAANPAARALLAPSGNVRPAPFQLHDTPAWSQLRAAVERAFDDGTWPSDAHELTLDFGQGDKRTLQVRGRFTRRRSIEPGTTAPEEFCVLFLEDLRAVQSRLKQDKLAAMGRVSAGIAHEIRNPLAAIAQANALMLEDAQDAAQRKLATIVADNVERLKRIVEDVLEVTPGLAPDVHAIDAASLVAQAALDFASTAQLKLGPESRLQVQLPTQPLGVLFDAEHLRRVLVNLLENARRHGSDKPGAMRLALSAFDEHSAVMRVASDGEPIPPEVERHLFEPFFSTRSRGTGLGLYICRELCERYGASIDYRQRPAGDRHRNEFVVVMRRAPLTETDPQLQV